MLINTKLLCAVKPFIYPFRRHVSFLSPFGVAFNCRPSFSTPLWTHRENPVGLFGWSELIRPEGFTELSEEVIHRVGHLVNEATCNKRRRLLTSVFDDLSDELCRVADMAEFVRIGHPDTKFATYAEVACREVSNLVEKLNTHRGLYDCLHKIVKHGEDPSCHLIESDIDKHVAKLFLLDFQQSGIHLDEHGRYRVVLLKENILRIGQEFSAGCFQPRNVHKSCVPQNILHYFTIIGDNQIVLNGLHNDVQNDLAREFAYKNYYSHEIHQADLLKQLLQNRKELAHVCGYSSYAHRALVESLAETPEKVNAFLTFISDDLRERVSEEFKILSKIKNELDPKANEIGLWDIPFLTHHAKTKWFNIDNDVISEYFSLGACMDGLNMLFRHLFGIEMQLEKTRTGEVWHESVYKLSVNDQITGLLGHIYCDFFMRPGKPYQDCHFTIRGGRSLPDGSYQNPTVVLMLNMIPPKWSHPCLLTPSMVDNLFHEMGHAIHSMLGRTKYQHVTGTRCSTDFAEVPSTLMEYFSSDVRFLSLFARHYQTGQCLPTELLNKLCASKNAFFGIDVQTQLIYALLDQRYHGGENITPAIVSNALSSIHKKHHYLPYPNGIAWDLRFSHLVGYGARYYSYLMARAVASSIWQLYFQMDPLCSDAGAKYRSECLSFGGGKPSSLIVSSILNRPNYTSLPRMLSEAIINEIDAKSQYKDSLL